MSVFKEYFSFNKRERNGTIVLLIIITGLIFTYNFSDELKAKQNLSFIDFEKEVNDFKNSLIKQKSNPNNFSSDSVIIDSLFYFNPNTITNKEWSLLGFNERLIKTINNFKSKGGEFYNNESLKRIYGLSPNHYKRLEQYILLERNIKYKKKKYYKNKYKNNKYTKDRKSILSDFDPNTATKSELIKLGFSDRVISTMFKFKSKGGKFYKAEDLKKIYGIKESFYNKLKPYIKINTENNKSQSNIIVQINTANQDELTKISGIGNTFAARIIKYRNMLGGYSNKNQLLEVYGITQEVLDKISNNISIDKSKIKKININTADFKALIKHPYISKENTNDLLEYRKFEEKISSLKDLKANAVFSDKEFKKIEEYLSLK